MSNTENSSKIIYTNFARKPDAPRTQNAQSAKVLRLQSSTKNSVDNMSDIQLRIHWERDTRRYEHMEDFFRVLLSTGHVNIIMIGGENNDKNTIMEVADNQGTYAITIGYFVRMTIGDIKDIPKIDDYEEYLMQLLSSVGIRVGLCSGDNSIVKTELSEEEKDDWRPDKISIYRDDIGGSYTCELFREEDLPIGGADVENLELLGKGASLLDLMILAYDDAESEGLSVEDVWMEITFTEGENSLITKIPTSMLEEILMGAIRRSMIMDISYTFTQMRDRYFKKKVIPKLAPLSYEE